MLAIGFGGWLGRNRRGGLRKDLSQVSSHAEHRDAGGHLSVARDVAEPVTTEPLFDRPVWGAPRLPLLSPKAPPSYSQIAASATVGKGMNFSLLRKQARVIIPLGDDQVVDGQVNLVTNDHGGWLRIGGRLSNGGTFSLAKGPQGQQTGQIIMLKQGVGYQLETRLGDLILHKRSLDSMLCEGIPLRVHPNQAQADASAAPPPEAIGAIPTLDSRPEATGVLYLSFGGETVTDPFWNGGSTIYAAPAVINGIPISTTQMTDVWARVAEDFKPFEVTVTTSRARYDNAPVGQRMMAVITPTQSWYSSSVGGVAGIGSFRGPYSIYSFSSTVPCWVFNNYNTSDMALTISHELGHTVGLHHDGLKDSFGNLYVTYYYGHGTPPLSWGPIMGAPWDCIVTQWSDGDYTDSTYFANNQEDQLAIMGNLIGEPLSTPALPADDAPDTPVNAPPLNFGLTVNVSGLISPHIKGAVSSPDIDYYQLDTGGGAISLTATPGAVDPDLDIQMELHSQSDGVLLISAAQDDLGAKLTTTVGAGTYFVVVKGRARPGVDGYSIYGCNGPYTITGTVPPLAIAPTISQPPASQTVAAGAKVTLSVVVNSNVKATYQWLKNDVDILGKTASTLVFASAQPGDSADYRVRVTNPAGSVLSDPATLLVRFKPSITTQPGPPLTTVAAGTPVVYTVTSTGSAPLTYKWKKDGVVLPSVTGPTLGFATPGWFDQGSYTVLVSNDLGTVTSVAVKLVVTSAPIITVPPPALKPLLPGGAGSVTVTAVGTPPLTYQWYNGVAQIPGATKPTYSWKAATTAVEGNYTLQVTNGAGNTVSSVMTVDVMDGPKITVQPVAPPPVASGAALSLSVAATGDAIVPLSYQWQLNGVNIPLATGATYAVPSATWFDQGTYRVIVSNPAASVTSKTAAVVLHSPPVIVTPAASMKVARNGGGTLKVVATGNPALAYQWQKGGVTIPGAKAAAYTLSHASDATVDDYSVMVTNAYGSTPGGTAHVTVEDAPVISRAPLALTKPVGGSAAFDVVVSGTPSLRYQWQKNSVNIPGETNATLALNTLALSSSASYRVLVTNDVGTAVSAAAKLSVLAPPAITKDPLGQVLYEYDNVTFTGAATGAATLLYQWQKDGMDIPGAKSASLTLNGLRLAHSGLPSQAGDYTLVVTNSVGTATSKKATLSLSPVPLPDLTMLSPYRGPIGAKVLVRGTNLGWTTKVTFNGTAGTFVKVNTSELIVTVPKGATTGPLVVQTLGGSISSADATALHAPAFTVTAATDNDNFDNARFLTGTDFYTTGDSNLNATPEVGDPTLSPYEANPKHTIWYRWRPPANDYYSIYTVGSNFNTMIGVFSIRPDGSLALVTWNDNVAPDDELSFVAFVANKTEDYYIMVDGERYSFTDTSPNPLPVNGDYLQLNVYRALQLGDQKVTAVKPGQPVAALEQSQGATLESVSPERSVGGTPATATALVAPDAGTDLSNGQVVHAAVDFAIDSTDSSSGTFSWLVRDQAAEPLVGLVFDAGSKQVMKKDAAGATTPTGQLYVPGGDYHLDIQVDINSHTWGAMLNGIWIIENESVPSGASFTDLAAVWIPAQGASQGGRMRFSHAHLSADTAPQAADR